MVNGSVLCKMCFVARTHDYKVFIRPDLVMYCCTYHHVIGPNYRAVRTTWPVFPSLADYPNLLERVVIRNHYVVPVPIDIYRKDMILTYCLHHYV